MAKERKGTTTRGYLFSIFIDVPLFLLGILTASSFLASLWWIFELACHFRFQYAVGLAAIGAFTFVYNYLSRSLLAWALFLSHVPMITPFYMPVSPFSDIERDAGTEIECAAVNVSEDNPDLDRVLTWVRQEEPDLLLMMEVDLDWVKQQTQLDQQYYYRRTLSRSEQYGQSGSTDEYEFAGQYGMVLFSKKPIRDARIIRPPDTTISVLYTDIEVENEIIHFTGVHTPSPTGSHLARARNKVLAGVAERVSKQSGPRIVMGDLNTTSYSPYFWSFLDRAGVKDTRKGWGLQPTWPVSLGFGLFRICLDHCLASKEFEVTHRGVGPDIGSDHLPIQASLRLENSTDD